MSAADTLAAEDASVRALIEDSHLLAELTRHPGWAVLTRRAEDSLAHWQTRMNTGQCPTLEDYRHCAGFLEGSRQVLAIPETVARMVERRAAEREELEGGEDGEYDARTYDEET